MLNLTNLITLDSVLIKEVSLFQGCPYRGSHCTPSYTYIYRLMGPRRKLSLAISEVKKQREEEEGEGERVAEGGREGERRGGESEGGGGGGGGREGSGRTGRPSSRPPLIKQPSTELTAAYRQVSIHDIAVDSLVFTFYTFQAKLRIQ